MVQLYLASITALVSACAHFGQGLCEARICQLILFAWPPKSEGHCQVQRYLQDPTDLEHPTQSKERSVGDLRWSSIARCRPVDRVCADTVPNCMHNSTKIHCMHLYTWSESPRRGVGQACRWTDRHVWGRMLFQWTDHANKTIKRFRASQAIFQTCPRSFIFISWMNLRSVPLAGAADRVEG